MAKEAFQNEIVGLWANKGSPDYAYFMNADDPKWVEAFWSPASPFKKKFEHLDLTSVVELACGTGRHSKQMFSRCGRLWLVDSSVDAIKEASDYFAGHRHVTAVATNGNTLPGIADQSVTAVLSYDAMVHFEAFTMFDYLNEISRVLKPGGRALLHYSNYSKFPERKATENPGWRNFMTKELVRYMSARAGLRIIETEFLHWVEPDSDALSLFEKTCE